MQQKWSRFEAYGSLRKSASIWPTTCNEIRNTDSGKGGSQPKPGEMHQGVAYVSVGLVPTVSSFCHLKSKTGSTDFNKHKHLTNQRIRKHPPLLKTDFVLRLCFFEAVTRSQVSIRTVPVCPVMMLNNKYRYFVWNSVFPANITSRSALAGVS